MRETPDFYRLYEYAACGLISFAMDGTIIHANQTLLNWLGCRMKEVQDTKFQNILGQGGGLYFSLFVLPSLQMQTEIKEISIEMKSTTESFPALFSAATFRLNEDSTMTIDATIFKITDRKKYEAELLKEKDEVKQINVSQNLVLEEVAFNQAHLIRAPLANILGLTEMLNENTETSADVRETIVMLKNSAHKLDTVIKSIVNLIN